MSVSDIELVGLSQAGDKRAFGELVRRYQSLVYAVAFNVTGNANSSQERARRPRGRLAIRPKSQSSYERRLESSLSI